MLIAWKDDDGNKMKGDESFGGEKGEEALGPRKSNWLVDGVSEVP